MNFHDKLALGTVQFGLDYGISNASGQIPIDEAKSIINHANVFGIKTLDTASAYGNSEEVLGNLHQNRFDIVTKFISENNNLTLENQLEFSLKKLKVNQIYGYLAHKPFDVFENNLLWIKLTEFKSQGKVKKIGFSFDSPEEYFVMEQLGFVPDLVQLPYNYFDNRFLNIMEKLKKNNCEIHTRSPFLQGLFFSKIDKLSKQFDAVKPIIENLQKSYKDQLEGALLKYALQNVLIDKVVFGVQNAEQLIKNIESINTASNLDTLGLKIENDIVQPSKWIKNK
jgi:aryl-alcohol dehydrogenase-like predicted oxidoreductase